MTSEQADPTAERLMRLLERLRKMQVGESPQVDGRVTMPQLALLEAIAGAPGSGVLDIAEELGLTAATVSVHLQRLEAEGLLERQPHPQDGRAIQTFLTEHGQAVCQQARSFRRGKARRLLAGLTPVEAANLLALLDKAIAAAEGVAQASKAVVESQSKPIQQDMQGGS